jgi:hypothetical protein
MYLKSISRYIMKRKRGETAYFGADEEEFGDGVGMK